MKKPYFLSCVSVNSSTPSGTGWEFAKLIGYGKNNRWGRCEDGCEGEEANLSGTAGGLTGGV